MSKKIHCIGIGGIGMSGLARLYLHEGATVSGSDRTETELTQSLQSEGVTVTIGHNPENIPEDAELVVYSDAVGKDNAERVRAAELGIPQMQYFEALAEIANQYYLIAVSGTHGKTTTTAMLADILEEACFDPTAIVGSLRTKTGSNYRAGKGKYFIAEADEYRNHFRFLKPDLLVITNVEFDHPDYFESLADVQHVYAELAKRVPEDGAIVANPASQTVSPILTGVQAKIIDYTKAFDPRLRLPQPGVFNQMNAAAAKAAALELGIEEKSVISALEGFAGTKRRFEYKGECNGAPVFDDYAHHPTEIEATIRATKERYPERRIVAVFQPHTYTRTHELLDDFARALKGADRVLLAPIYAAREENVSGVSSELLAEKIEGRDAQVFGTLAEITETVKNSVETNDVVLIMGAGDVTKVANQVVS